MYFEIQPIQKDKYTAMGMINVDARFYLEKGDEGYDKYIAENKVIVDDVERLNPFCTHSIQFEHDVTEEEILWCFEFALGITHRNYLVDDLHCKNGGQIVNQPFGYSGRRVIYRGAKDAPTDETYLKFHPLKAIQKEKISRAETKINQLKDVDFTKVKTIGKYRVRKQNGN